MASKSSLMMLTLLVAILLTASSSSCGQEMIKSGDEILFKPPEDCSKNEDCTAKCSCPPCICTAARICECVD
ncbi:hypothetical protein M5689_016988 [Euphorbia peplus]|nr:hypothetical protein M5689_016988 [Euphorbia peplus]